LAPPLQVQSSSGVLLAVPCAVASRHLPDPTPTTVPSESTVHCWLAAPVQSLMSTPVPSAVPAPMVSRHLLS
jgi:hypothetical protein